ncbi:MAG: ATP-binding protein, partial [Anaerolineales bacterium]
DADDTTVEYLDMISSEIRGAIQIIENLLSLTHKEEPTMEEIPVTELVTLGLSRQVPPEGVNVTTEISSETLSLFADPSQIVHVLENLLSNAYQSMPDGGELIIKVWEDGSRVCISVTDTGWGIPKENLKKIFEPLFTTKARGFGFGLSISRDLIGMNNGSIEVNSEEGVGSSFTLKLPGVS